MTVPDHESTALVATGGNYSDLLAEMRSRGLFGRRPWTYVGHAAVNLLASAAVVVAMVAGRGSWWLLLLAPVLAVTSTQLGFLGHDIGHLQVTHDARRSRQLGLLTANLLTGLSYGWWVPKHNAHHAHPNDLESDPDVRPGVLIFDAGQASGRQGLGAWATRHQAALFFPLLLGEAVNLHAASVRTVMRPGVRQRGWESALLAAHFAGYVALLAATLSWPQTLVFVAVHKGLQGVYLGCTFAPNHKGMPMLTGAAAADPLLRQVLTSRNIRGGILTDALLGGLNYQIEHHLFPSMPRANLKTAQPVVQQFCLDHGVSYLETSMWASYAAALGHLRAVGDPLRG